MKGWWKRTKEWLTGVTGRVRKLFDELPDAREIVGADGVGGMTMFWIYLCAFVPVSAAMGTLPAWAGAVCAFAWGFMVCNEKWKAK